jgi:hypothetical protein
MQRQNPFCIGGQSEFGKSGTDQRPRLILQRQILMVMTVLLLFSIVVQPEKRPSELSDGLHRGIDPKPELNASQ